MDFFTALTVDLEDWYHICPTGRYVPRAAWDHFPSRVVSATESLLSILREYNVRGTFFVLGYIAERYPELVRRVHDAGHEIGSHGFDHYRLPDLSPQAFEEDLRRSLAAIEAACGRRPVGFRAPEWSMSASTRWAYDILARHGLRYDSSTAPGLFLGSMGLRPDVHVVSTDAGDVTEFPLTVSPLLGLPFPFTGGASLRMAPARTILRRVRRLIEAGQPVVVYVHPWEFDVGFKPRLPVPFYRRFVHDFNLHSTEPKVRMLLDHFPFRPMAEVLREMDRLPVAAANSLPAFECPAAAVRRT